MSTFIINLNDTIALSDSAVVELAKVINTCQPCLREVETNCNDVKIVAIICIAIVIVALIARCAVLSWKDAEIKAANAEREAKENEADIAKRKQKADLRDKLVFFLEKNTTKEEYDENAGKMIKKQREFDSEECQYYIEVLKSLIKEEAIPNFNKQKDNETKNP